MGLRNFVLFTLPLACSLVVAPGGAHAVWSGWARCTVEIPGQGYINVETHTWTVVGAATTVEGTGTWEVDGKGARNESNQIQSEHVEWTISGRQVTAVTGNPPDGPRFRVAIDPGANTLSITKQHAQ